MTDEAGAPTREELVEALRTGGEAFTATVRALSPGQLEQGRYESGWNARQILAHVAAIEWTYPRLLEIPEQPVTAGGEPPTRQAQGGIDAYNARQVEKRAGATVEELLEEFERNRRATIEAVANADPGLFARPVRSAGGRTGPLGRVFEEVAVGHVVAHGRDIAGKG